MIRKSQRSRRKPEVFVPGDGALEPVNEELSDASEDAADAEEGYEEEDGEEESKRNRDSFSPQARLKAKRAPKQAAAKNKRARSQPATNVDCVLYEAVAGGASLEATATDWLSSFNNDPGVAQAEMLNFLLLSCGGKKRSQERIDVDDLEPEDWKAMMDDVIEALREQPTAGANTPPDMRDKKFRASFLSFWRKLARACTLRQHNIRDGTADAAVDSTVTMLVYLSSSSVYQVREYCTSAGLELGLEVSVLIAELTKELDLAKGRLTGPQHSKKNESIAKQVRGYQQDLDRLVVVADNIYNSILMHRYKDTHAEVRAVSIEYLGRWMEYNPNMWLHNKERPSIQYPGWMLSDASPKVRLAALQAIHRGLKKEHREVVEPFIEQFLSRLVQMTRDIDEAVAVAALKLLRGCQAIDLLDEVDDEVIDQIDEMVFDTEAPYSVRCEALGFVIDHTTGFEDLTESNQQQPRKQQQKQGGVSATERKSRICLQLQTLAQFVEHHAMMHANGAEPDLLFADLLVHAAVSSPLKDCIWEWSSYVAILLSDSTVFTGEPFTPLQSRILIRMLMVAVVMVRAESVSDIPIPLPVLEEVAETKALPNQKMLLEPRRVWSLCDFIERQDRDEDDDGEQDEDDQTFLGPNNTTLHTSMSILQSLNQSRGAAARGGGGRRGNKKLKPLDRDDLTQLQESFTVHLVQCLPALLSRYCDDDCVVAMLLECVSALDMQLCALPAHQGEARKLIKDLINLLGQTQSPVVTRPLCLAVLHCIQNDSLRKPDVIKALQQAVAGVWEKIQLGRQALEDESSSLPDEAPAQGGRKKRRSSRASSSSSPAAGASTPSHRLLPLQAAVNKLRWLLFGGDCRQWVKLSEDELYDVLPELIDSATDFHNISSGEGLDLQPRFRIVCDAVYVLTAMVLWRLHDVFDEIRALARAKLADKENENPDNSMRSEADGDGESDDEREANPVRGAIAVLLSYREKLVDVITTLMNLTPMTGNPDELNTTSVSLFAQGEEDDPLPALESNYLHAIKRFCFVLVGDLRALFKSDLRENRHCEDLVWEPPREVLNALKDYFDAEAARVQQIVNRVSEEQEAGAADDELAESPRAIDRFVADLMLQPLSRSILANPSTLNRRQAAAVLTYIVDQGPETTELVRTVAQRLKDFNPVRYLEVQMVALKSAYEQQVLPLLHTASNDEAEELPDELKDQLAAVQRLSTRLCQTMGVGQAKDDNVQTALLNFFQAGLAFGCSDLQQVLFVELIAPYQRLLSPEGKQHVVGLLDNAVAGNDRLQELLQGSHSAASLASRYVQAVNNLRFALTGSKPSKPTPTKKTRSKKTAPASTTKQPRAGAKGRKRRKRGADSDEEESSSGNESDNFNEWLEQVSTVHQQTPEPAKGTGKGKDKGKSKAKPQQKAKTAAARSRKQGNEVAEDGDESDREDEGEDNEVVGRPSKTVVKKRKNKTSAATSRRTSRSMRSGEDSDGDDADDVSDGDDAESVAETLPSRTVKKQKRPRRTEPEPMIDAVVEPESEESERRSSVGSKRSRKSASVEQELGGSDEDDDDDAEVEQSRPKKKQTARPASRSSARSQAESEQAQEDDALFADLDLRPSARLRYR